MKSGQNKYTTYAMCIEDILLSTVHKNLVNRKWLGIYYNDMYMYEENHNVL